MIQKGYEAFEAELTALDREHSKRFSVAIASTSAGIWPLVRHELTELRTHTLEALRALMIGATDAD